MEFLAEKVHSTILDAWGKVLNAPLSIARNSGNKAKEWISKRVSQQNKVSQLFRKTFLTPWSHTYVCLSGGKKCLFFGKFGVLCFLVTSVLRFALLPYYWREQRFREKLLQKSKILRSWQKIWGLFNAICTAHIQTKEIFT